MIRNRIIFMGTWLMFTIALFVFPGFECKGLIYGMIIGWWPVFISNQFFEALINYYPLIFLLMIVIVSGATVSLFSWLMDKAEISKKILPFLFCAMLSYACYFAFFGITYEEWQHSPHISQAMESSECNYEPTRWDFWEEIIIPKLLAGGLIGLYVVSGLGTLFSLLKLLLRKIKNPNKPNSADVLPRAADL